MKDAIRYKVTVTATTQKKQITGKDWAPISQEFEQGREKAKDVYGYTPEIEKLVTKETQIFEQIVDELDMRSLIGAVNKITF